MDDAGCPCRRLNLDRDVRKNGPVAVTSVPEYLDSLTPDRREVVGRLMQVMRENLNPGFEEGILYGGPAFYVPHSVYPPGYQCDPKLPVMFVGVSSPKGHVSIHAFCVYCDHGLLEWFQAEYAKTGFKLDMGKGCVRIKKMDQVPYALFGELVKRVSVEDFLGTYTRMLKR